MQLHMLDSVGCHQPVWQVIMIQVWSSLAFLAPWISTRLQHCCNFTLVSWGTVSCSRVTCVLPTSYLWVLHFVACNLLYSLILTWHSCVMNTCVFTSFCMKSLNISQVINFYLQIWPVHSCSNIHAFMNTHIMSTLTTVLEILHKFTHNYTTDTSWV